MRRKPQQSYVGDPLDPTLNLWDLLMSISKSTNNACLGLQFKLVDCTQSDSRALADKKSADRRILTFSVIIGAGCLITKPDIQAKRIWCASLRSFRI